MGELLTLPCINEEVIIPEHQPENEIQFSTQNVTAQATTNIISPIEIPWHLTHTRATKAWEVNSGEEVVIAVLDTGLDKRLNVIPAENIIGGRNFTTDYDGDPENYHDNHVNASYMGLHGTGMATLIAGRQRNETGTVGIARNVKMLIGKVMNSLGEGDTDLLANAIRWATDNGADIISMSLTAEGYDDYLYDAVKYAHAAGVTMLAASGNNVGNNSSASDEIFYPASFPEVISVGAHGENDFPVYNFATNSLIDMSAPGERVTTVNMLNGTNRNQPYYGSITGTSPATAIIAGAMAIILSAFRKMYKTPTKQDLYAQLMSHLRPLSYSSQVKSLGKGCLDFAYGELQAPADDGKTVIVYTSNTAILSSRVLSQVSVDYMRKELKIPAHVDPENDILATNMEIAKSFLIEETFNTLEELDAKPMAVGLFKRIVADLYYERMSTSEVKQSSTYVDMLKRLRKVVV